MNDSVLTTIACLAFVVLATLDPSYPAWTSILASTLSCMDIHSCEHTSLHGHPFLRAHFPCMQGSGWLSGFEITILGTNELLLCTAIRLGIPNQGGISKWGLDLQLHFVIRLYEYALTVVQLRVLAHPQLRSEKINTTDPMISVQHWEMSSQGVSQHSMHCAIPQARYQLN